MEDGGNDLSLFFFLVSLFFPLEGGCGACGIFCGHKVGYEYDVKKDREMFPRD